MCKNSKGQFDKGGIPHNKGKTRFDHQEIVRLYEKHKNATKVAEILGTYHGHILKILKRNNVEIIKPPRTNKYDEFKVEIISLYKEGYSTTEISKRMPQKISYATINTCLKVNGIDIKKAGFQKGSSNPAYIRGFTTDEHGYVLIKEPDHPRCNNNGYVREHILVMEETVGRRLNEKEVVHHINEDVQDNRPENLMLFSDRGKHTKYHWELKRKAKQKTP